MLRWASECNRPWNEWCWWAGRSKEGALHNTTLASLKKCNLMLKRAHLPLTWLIDFTLELQLAIAIILLLATGSLRNTYKWYELFSSLRFGQVEFWSSDTRQTDRRTESDAYEPTVHKHMCAQKQTGVAANNQIEFYKRCIAMYCDVLCCQYGEYLFIHNTIKNNDTLFLYYLVCPCHPPVTSETTYTPGSLPYPEDSVVQFTCKNGYSPAPQASMNVTCTQGEWSGSPTCVRDSGKKRPHFIFQIFLFPL